ncbi:hypothetical protein A2881_01145 [Candidatus Peribacteria bacterium RIFCSPHIGHO2_01_FULL_55_13]|nr:MAG: hypothetical protein A2881_01145 [Candidatus Peribacteria bacterium RIFCSPHIGHO2_01_FULL_55_13]
MSTDASENGSKSDVPLEQTSKEHERLKDTYLLLLQQRDESRAQAKGTVENPFDLSTYERLLESPRCRELTPEDWESVGRLYQHSEIAADVFETLAEGQVQAAEQMLADGGMVDRWHATDEELAVLRSLNPDYVCSDEEFRALLEGRHGRSADFRAWGLFDESEENIHGIAAGFFPPKEDVRLAQHSTEVQNFFRGQHAEMHFIPSGASRHDVEKFAERAPTTAEFYMIAAGVRGAGTVAFEHMLQKTELEYPGLTDWYLLRFGSMRMVQPDNGNHARDAENSVSKTFFKKRGFGTCGECYMEHAGAGGAKYQQIAARRSRSGSVIAVHPTWKVMAGSAPQVRENSREELAVLQMRAKQARKK